MQSAGFPKLYNKKYIYNPGEKHSTDSKIKNKDKKSQKRQSLHTVHSSFILSDENTETSN